ncbi:MAG: S16 family serine protease [Ignisphaera sp.]
MVYRTCMILTLLMLVTISLPTHSLTYGYILDELRHVTIVAVSQLSNGSYIGVSADLYVRVACPGSGHVYVETLPLSEIDLQASTRIAALVASSIANISFYSCDFYASIKSDSPIIGGPSASGVTAVAFAAALLRLPLNESIVMTGMVLPDGSVGPVGGLKYKLDAAVSRGAKMFLVPYGQTKDTIYRIVSQRIGPSVITRVIPETIDLISYGAQLNISVVPIANIFEALEIFTNHMYKVIPTTSSLPNKLSNIYAALKNIQYEWIFNLSNKIIAIVNESKAVEDKALSSLSGYSSIYVRNTLQNIDSNINSLRIQAESLVSAEKLYAASSLYFQALIYAYQRLYLLKAIVDGAFISKEINIINNSIYDIINYIHRYHIENGMDTARLSIVINTLDRAYEALIYLNRTLTSQYIDSISQYLALASARIYTAWLWSTLLDKYPYIGSEIPTDDLNRMALYISTLSQNIYTYIIAFSSSIQIPGDMLSEAMFRYSLLTKVDNTLDRLALGISSISYMHLILTSLFLRDYSSAIEALNKTISTSLSLPDSILPIDIPLYIEMAKTFESYSQTQLTMLSRLSIILSIYRILSTELRQPQQLYTKINGERTTTITIKERNIVTTTITITTFIEQPHTITVTTTIATPILRDHINLRDVAIILIMAIVITMAIIWMMFRTKLASL